jgi:predicted phage tail protein
MPSDNPDLTARLVSLREVLHNEIAAVQDLLAARVDGVDAQREVLLTGLHRDAGLLRHEMDQRLDQLQLQINRRLSDLRDQLDERFHTQTKAVDTALVASDKSVLAMKAQLDERFETQSVAMHTAFTAAEVAVQAALTAQKEAVKTAAEATEKRFEGVNEFRKTLSDQTQGFMSRDEVNVRIDALTAAVARNAENLAALELRLTSRLDLNKGQAAGADKQIEGKRLDTAVLLQLAAVVISVVAAVIILFHK